MNSGKAQTRSATAIPRIAHVEVGGSVGGSLIKLRDYLKYSDPQAFQREVIFYRRPPGSEMILDSCYPTIDLGLSVPPMSRAAKGGTRQKARAFLNGHPRLRRWTSFLREGWQLLARLSDVFSLARQFKRRKYDLIHCNNSFTYQVPTILAARLARKPLVCHFRTIRRLSQWELWLSRIPYVIVPVCQTIAEDLQRQGVQTHVETCYDPVERPAVPTHLNEAFRKQLLRDGTMLVGMVSRLEDLKGVEDFLAAARLLRPTRPNVRYVIVGEGSRAKALKELAIKWDLGDHVCFAGFQKNVFDYCQAMDIFVSPSLLEGGPLVVLEAMQMGRPVVATRVGWNPELIHDGENGLLVNVSEPQSLASAIDSLLGDSQFRDRLAARAKDSTLHTCGPVAQAKRIDNLFLRVFKRELFEGNGQ
jgi:glycosyltransferase involved in cell wall biosynthesis